MSSIFFCVQCTTYDYKLKRKCFGREVLGINSNANFYQVEFFKLSCTKPRNYEVKLTYALFKQRMVRRQKKMVELLEDASKVNYEVVVEKLQYTTKLDFSLAIFISSVEIWSVK